MEIKLPADLTLSYNAFTLSGTYICRIEYEKSAKAEIRNFRFNLEKDFYWEFPGEDIERAKIMGFDCGSCETQWFAELEQHLTKFLNAILDSQNPPKGWEQLWQDLLDVCAHKHTKLVGLW